MTHTPFPPSNPDHRRTPIRRFGLALIVATALVASACGSTDDSSPATDDSTATDSSPANEESTASDSGDVVSTDDEGTTSVDEQRLADELAALSSTTLSDADRDGLVFMREEEKLALDVYQALYDVWGLKIFDNISAAEQTHTDSVKTLLERFEIPDPALDQAPGVFVNADLQVLYDDLVARGSESITEALLVGALIEDLDIADLQARASDDPAIALVYSNLERGSRNHLRAFMQQLDRDGVSYTPSYISQADFDAIVSSSTERGGGGGGGRGAN